MTLLRRLAARTAAVAVGLSPATLLVTSPGCDETTCSTGGSTESQTMVTNEIRFVVHDDPSMPTVIDGFDLDHVVSTGYPDPSGCVKIDQTDPSGRQGIDNALAPMFETIITLTDDAVYGLIETSIEDGSLLIMVRIDGIDDRQNDSCVNVTILKGTGKPELGTDGSIAPDQTFGVDEATPVSHGVGRIVDGELIAGPFEATVPLSFFQVRANMRFHDAYLRGRLTAEGGLGDPNAENPSDRYAILGGGIELEQVFDLADQAGAMDHNASIIAGGVRAFVPGIADLDFDGESCRQISAALQIRATPAHLLGDSL